MKSPAMYRIFFTGIYLSGRSMNMMIPAAMQGSMMNISVAVLKYASMMELSIPPAV